MKHHKGRIIRKVMGGGGRGGRGLGKYETKFMQASQDVWKKNSCEPKLKKKVLPKEFDH